MDQIVNIESVYVYNQMRGVKTLHPLVSVVDLSTAYDMPAKTFNFGVYTVFLKDVECGVLKYGRNHYDYQEGTLVFVSPGQVVSVQPNIKTYIAKGWALLFHPDLIKGTSLGKNIQNYSFFSYDVNEALHLSEIERQLVIDCFCKIKSELEQSIDKHSKTIINANIELLLNYSIRFYDRQFITRDNINRGLLEKFEDLLNNYYESNSPQSMGLPCVSYFAYQLHLSPNYFGDLIRKETGKTAQEYIQTKIIDLSKEKILNLNQSISQVAYDLGFKYPQHFTRLFKQKVGISPIKYRNLM